MEVKDKTLSHIHRQGNFEEIWIPGNKIVIDESFNSAFYLKLLEIEQTILDKYKEYDIDFIIAMMEEMISKNLVEDDCIYEFKTLLEGYYLLRREQALEEARKLYNPTAPSRFHSIYLTDNTNLGYWGYLVGDNDYKVFTLELNGTLFTSSDDYFPDKKLLFDLQVENAKAYWKPKEIASKKEYIFKGIATIKNN